MEEFKLSTELSRNNWFGCLTDGRDKLVASAFGASSKMVRAYLTDYLRKTSAVEPTLGKHHLTHEMVRLFDGHSISRPVTLNTDMISKFQRRVYRVLEQIPRGRVTTYGLISKHLGSAPRAVGGAVASNPWPLFVPCQRVVNGDLTIGNYGLCGSLDRTGTITKQNLLDREGVPIRGSQIDQRVLWNPTEKTD
ncbi:MGMT family protein [Candidatus Bathyarchaeota archaeon]|nr:MAG: MGMT family protein [Candidatus Bathyarchaeota archaeon]